LLLLLLLGQLWITHVLGMGVLVSCAGGGGGGVLLGGFLKVCFFYRSECF